MPGMNREITIVKRNAAGREVWHYTGTILRREEASVVIEARFRSPDLPFMGIVLKQGDRFVEVYFTDHWYNTFEIHDREDDHLKGWYCNITRPAVFEAEDRLSYEDLALDLWVDPQGNQTVLDEDEFADLELDEATRQQARAAMNELQELFRQNQIPGL
jgi:predicted RNA-binding protein associated with RNAse of E/G family